MNENRCKTANITEINVSPLANFVRNASYQEKLAVFTQTLKTAAKEQRKVIEQAAAMR